MKKRAADGWQMDMPAGCQGKQRTPFSPLRRKRRFLASKVSDAAGEMDRCADYGGNGK